MLPLQQPFGHELASQTHAPAPLHSCPVAHAAQAAPPAPQDELDSFESASHDPPLQHPPHDVPPQLHAPLAQAWPEEHALHAAPPVPHSEAFCEP